MEQEQYNPLVNPNPSTSATNDEQHFSSAEEVDSDQILLSDEYERNRSCKDEYQFFCKACDQNLKFRKAGARAITDHVGTEKHKKNVAVLNANAPMTDFVKQKSKPKLPLPALIKHLNALKQRLNLSLNEEFYGEETMDLLRKLEQNGAAIEVRKLKRAFKQFYANSQKYLEDWSEQFLEASEVVGDWVIFESEPTLEKVRKAYKHFCGTTAEELDALFGEVAELQQIMKQFEDTGGNDQTVDEKWTTIFKNRNFSFLWLKTSKRMSATEWERLF
uniref:U1-type domain-containing protein n=1 Tax=Globodera rostochiensis TaxID=31243 RepID=A0A914H9P9_GLORO